MIRFIFVTALAAVCISCAEASGVHTAEGRDRSELHAPPSLRNSRSFQPGVKQTKMSAATGQLAHLRVIFIVDPNCEG